MPKLKTVSQSVPNVKGLSQRQVAKDSATFSGDTPMDGEGPINNGVGITNSSRKVRGGGECPWCISKSRSGI